MRPVRRWLGSCVPAMPAPTTPAIRSLSLSGPSRRSRRTHRNDEILLRVDSAGASHELIDWCREGQIEFSVGYDLTETVRSAILQIPEHDWVCSLDQDGRSVQRAGLGSPSTSTWPLAAGPRVRQRERAHPGAQLSFTDCDGHRFQRSSPTDRPDRRARA